MAAYNWNLYLTDAGDQGTGPYTGVLRLNPTTVASGGTSVKTVGGAGTGLGFGDVVNALMERARNYNAEVYNLDSLN